jgi:hypothetical protein
VSSAFGYDISSLTLREKQSLRKFKNWVFRKKRGLEGEEVTGGWRTQHNSSSIFVLLIKQYNHQIKENEIRGHIAPNREGFG